MKVVVNNTGKKKQEWMILYERIKTKLDEMLKKDFYEPEKEKDYKESKRRSSAIN